MRCVASFFGCKNIVEINSCFLCRRNNDPFSEKFSNFSADNWMLITVKDTRSAILLHGCNSVFKFKFNSSNSLKNSRVSHYRFPLWQKMFELSSLETSLWLYQAMYNVNRQTCHVCITYLRHLHWRWLVSPSFFFLGGFEKWLLPKKSEDFPLG